MKKHTFMNFLAQFIRLNIYGHESIVKISSDSGKVYPIGNKVRNNTTPPLKKGKKFSFQNMVMLGITPFLRIPLKY